MTKDTKKRVHRYFQYIIIVLIVSSALVAGIVFLNFNNFMNKEGEVVINSNEFYTLRGKPTDLQRALFKELTTELEKDKPSDLLLVEHVVKNFVADYYTWTNKQGPFDVGGSDFIFSLEGTNFYRSSRRYFYSEMANYINNNLKPEDLIEVESIVTGGADYASNYDYYGTEYNSFYIELSWTYKANELIDTSVFPTSGSFTVIVTPERRFEIARFY